MQTTTPDTHRWDTHLAVLHATVAQHASRPASPAASLAARRLLLDTIGCAIAGRHAPEVWAFENVWSTIEPGAFRLAGGNGLSLHAATQLIAMAATWDEACEGHALAHGRPGVPLIAALLPLALQRGATLAQLLNALVLGYEIGARAGAWLRIRPGMHVDANWPALGVAAGVAQLLGLPAAGIVQAIDIAACQLATSLYLPIASGHTARNTYLAHSASLGLQAAFSAAAGVDAPPGALAVYADAHAAAAQEPLPAPDVELLRDAYLKPFAAVRHVHYGAVAAQRLRAQLPADTAGITAVTLRVYEEATVYCGNRAPRTPIQAQFSLSFGLAAMLCFGDIDPQVYAAPRFDDAELRRIEALIVLEVDPALTASRQRGATLTVVHAGRQWQQSVDAIPGDATWPLNRDALCAKFSHYTARSITTDSAAAFCTAVLDAPDIDLHALWRVLVPLSETSSDVSRRAQTPNVPLH